MGLITKEVEVKICSYSVEHYEKLGYVIPRHLDKKGILRVYRNMPIIVKTEHLTPSSHVKVKVECDECGETMNVVWKNYTLAVKEDGRYYCNKCAMKLYGTENMRKIKLVKGISFEQWCISNLKLDVLGRFDVELNNCKPSEIGFSPKGKHWFKCERDIHGSELKSISTLTSGYDKSVACSYCQSFAQYLIDLYGENALLKYWDYEKNANINPFEIRKNSRKKVWIKCINPEHNHKSYYVQCNSFTSMNSRCPRCAESKIEVAVAKYLDSKDYNYVPQKAFSKCIYKKRLRFDFYLPKYNLCIEGQGIQHYEPIDFANKGQKWAEEQFEEVKIKDDIKRKFCENNSINLLEIKYTDFDNIEQILDDYLSQFKNIKSA